MTNEEEVKKEPELEDVEIAELANTEIKKRDAEIKQLKKELAKQKLLSQADDDEEPSMSREDCVKTLGDANALNYDYAEAACRLCDIEVSEGHPHPFGANGTKVQEFLQNVIEDCDGDKSRFTSIYQSRLAKDEPEVALAYAKYKSEIQ